MTVTTKRAFQDEWWEPSETAREIICPEGEPYEERDTGLLDQFGRPITRPIERVKLGFHR